MKTKHLLFIAVLLTATILTKSYAQENTQVGLPEEATARLGKGGINIMRFSPEGNHLAVGTDVGVWLYDVQTGKETYIPRINASQPKPFHPVINGEKPVAFTEGAGQANTLAFSQDGKILASGGILNSNTQLWYMDTNTIHAITDIASNDLQVITFSEDNTTLVILHRSTIVHWDMKTGGKETKPLAISDNEGYASVVFSQDGSMLAGGTEEGRIHIWDTKTGEERKRLIGHANVGPLRKESVIVWVLAFSPDGKMIASGSEDKTVQLWDIEKDKKLATLEAHEGWITALAFSADGKTLASGDADKVIKLWDVDTCKERATLLGHKNTISTLTFVPEGKSQYSGCLASGSDDGTIRFWDSKNGKELVTLTSGHTESVKAVAFSEDDLNLTVAAANSTVGVWSLQTKHEIDTLDNQPSDRTTVAISADSKRFVSQGLYGFHIQSPIRNRTDYYNRSRSSIQLWDIGSEKEVPGPWQNAGSTNALTFSPDNHNLVACIDKGVFAWNMNTGAELFHFKSVAHFSSRLVFSPDGKLLSRNGVHRRTQVWDITAQRELKLPNNEEHTALAFSPDSTTIALGNIKGIILWNVTPIGVQENDRITDDSRASITSVLVFSPNGEILLDTKGFNIILWDTKGINLGTLLSGHTEPITTLVFSHDGKTLASGSDDGTVLLWDWEKVLAKRKTEQK